MKSIFQNPNNVPKPYHFSHIYTYLTADHYQQFFLQLVQECIHYGIIIPRIAEADGVFIRSWAGNFTKDKFNNPTDPDASITVHDKKYYGKGFTTIAFYAWCGPRWLPVWCKTYTGSVGEVKIYKEVVSEFLKTVPYGWKVIGYDKGADSYENRQFNQENNLLGTIPSRKNIVYDTLVEIDQERYFLESDLPSEMEKKKFGRLYDHRSQTEAGFSSMAPAYAMKSMNQMGLEAASIHMYKYFILQLLHALTAYKVNRPDLIMSWMAFTSIQS